MTGRTYRDSVEAARDLIGCYCPSDCACRTPYRVTVCGCTGVHGVRVHTTCGTRVKGRGTSGVYSCLSCFMVVAAQSTHIVAGVATS